MENWLSLQRRNLEHYGSRIAEKNLSVGDRNIVCIGGDVLRAMMRDKKKFPDSDIVSTQCRSDKALGITFIGEPSDVPDFYALVSGHSQNRMNPLVSVLITHAIHFQSLQQGQNFIP
jgi:hypothetical protein